MDQSYKSASAAIGAAWRGVMHRLRPGRRKPAVPDARAQSNPGIADYEKIELVWHPYLMRLCRPHARTPSANTDSLGFRLARHQGVSLTYTEYRQSAGCSVLLGNSAAFGVGATSDEAAIANQLALITDEPWYNLSGRAFNQLQDVMALLLFGAASHRKIVVLSGINDLLFALHFPKADPFTPMFWGQDRFLAWGNPGDPGGPPADVEERYRCALENIDRSLLLLARHAENRADLLYALQPLLAWIDKSLHPHEAEVCRHWDALETGFRTIHRPAVTVPWKDRFSHDVGMLCRRHAIRFIDLNRQPELRTAEHLFVDRIHLSDRGQRVVAEIIAGCLQTQPTATP
jgi:lysophospholipase L1-like esterase